MTTPEHAQSYDALVARLGRLLGGYLGGSLSTAEYMRQFYALRREMIDGAATDPDSGARRWTPSPEDGVHRDIWDQIFDDLEVLSPDYYDGPPEAPDRNQREPYEIGQQEFDRRQRDIRVGELRRNFGDAVVVEVEPTAGQLRGRAAAGRELAAVLEGFSAGTASLDDTLAAVGLLDRSIQSSGVTLDLFDAILWEAGVFDGARTDDGVVPFDARPWAQRRAAELRRTFPVT